MKQIYTTYRFFLLLLILFLSGCKSDIILHELKGEKRPVWFEPVPYGMVYIAPGHFQMGGGEPAPGQQPLSTRNVSVNSFWIDETEITNSEYRQYVHWAADSVAAFLTFREGLTAYMETDRDKQPYDPPRVDPGKIHEIWNDPQPEIRQAIDSLFYQGKERFHKREIDYRRIFYEYYYIDLQQAAQMNNRYNFETQRYEGTVIDPNTGMATPISDRSSFIFRERVPVYPDTLVWVRDFSYSYNEPWTQNYFHHKAFDQYPVVGVTWNQANAFCHWRSAYKEAFLAKNKILSIHPYRLPTEAEWEYA
ncbi:MAG TPA: SUMF1/EgtB/PvdO family nonheme iron enzyme, partial [Prolixibacteraceae bacterium]|nr:SUMF1/EgtB/PvdO family nonheme iron enzyme [Prolixibacteraceae bacterium]